MSIEMLRNMLLWSTLINYGLLLMWALFFVLAHDWLYRLHSKLVRVSVEQYDALNYGGMLLFKIGIIVFNLVPYIALRIVG